MRLTGLTDDVPSADGGFVSHVIFLPSQVFITRYAVHGAAVVCPERSLTTKLALVTAEPDGIVGIVKYLTYV